MWLLKGKNNYLYRVQVVESAFRYTCITVYETYRYIYFLIHMSKKEERFISVCMYIYFSIVWGWQDVGPVALLKLVLTWSVSFLFPCSVSFCSSVVYNPVLLQPMDLKMLLFLLFFFLLFPIYYGITMTHLHIPSTNV